MNASIEISVGDQAALFACRDRLGCPDLTLGPLSTLLIARSGGQIVGCAVYGREFFGRLFLSRLLVAAPCRRRGVATQLVRRVEAEVREGIVFTSTNMSNAPARSLLTRLGYLESGVIFNLDPGDPELVLAKRL